MSNNLQILKITYKAGDHGPPSLPAIIEFMEKHDCELEALSVHPVPDVEDKNLPRGLVEEQFEPPRGGFDPSDEIDLHTLG